MFHFKAKLEELIHQIKPYHKKYERYLPAVFFGLGFLLDIMTLGEIDDFSNILIFTSYLIFSGAFLAFEYQEINEFESNNKVFQFIFDYRNDIFHFFLGALLSAFTLFYFKSSSLATSFLFLIFMMSVLLLNETSFFQKNGIIVRTTMMKLCLLSYFILIIPTALGQAGSMIFAFCMVISLVLSGIAFFWLSKKRDNKEKNLKELLYPHLIVAGIFILLYLAKVLPPVPLSIKYIGIYHDVKKEENSYIVREERQSWKFWQNGDQVFKARPGDKVYVFAKIYSPGGFAGKVYIRWLKDTEDGWVTSDKIPLSITGGRNKGFRGYSYKANYEPGEWQVRIETDNGLEIGRISLEIIPDESTDERKFTLVKVP